MGDTVIISQRLGGITDEERRIEATGADLRSEPLWSLDEIRTNAASASVLILGAVEPFDAAALESLVNCRGIVRRGVGVDNVDLVAATRLGIVVANVPDASVEEVSDHALALLLTLERRVRLLDAAVHEGRWQRDPSEIQAVRLGIRRISELTLGIIGFGRIGRALARKSLALYARVIAVDPYAEPGAAASMGVTLTTKDEVLTRSDHLSLHVPADPTTSHLIDGAAFRRLRPGAILVNTARGGLVDEKALIAALQSGRLAAAGLDVSEREPIPATDPLLAVDRLVLTGHSALESTTSTAELRRGSIDAAIALLERRRPSSVVNEDVIVSPTLRLRH